MRKHISLAFYCIAAALILLQLGAGYIRISGQEEQSGLLYVVSLKQHPERTKEKQPTELDFDTLGEEMAQDNY